MEERKITETFVNPPPESAKRPLVLLVDDEQEIRRVATDLIQSLGFGLVVARHGAEGLELAGLYRPDVVLTDAFMPNMDGREMSRRIRADPSAGSPAIILMTSLYKSAQYKYEALKEFGVNEYLTKPLKADELRSVLRSVVGKRSRV